MTSAIGGGVVTWLVRLRPWLALVAVVLIAAMLLPPVWSYARHYVFVESLQFVIFATAAPALLVLGAPWRVLLLSRRPGRDPGLPGGGAGLADRLARSRSHRPGLRRPAAVLAVFTALVIVWRLPVMVNALARNPVLEVVEMVTLVAAGSGLWLELVESPPLLPGLSRPQRAAAAALTMWTIWILAYIMGFSHVAWFTAYGHAAARGLGTAADQQVATGILWAVPALCFAPVFYGMFVAWLRNSEDPDTELRAVSMVGSAAARPGRWPRPPRGWRRPPA